MRKPLIIHKIWLVPLVITAIALGTLVSVLVFASGDSRLTITAYSDLIRFQADGVVTLQVRIFDLSGKELWNSGVVSSWIVDWDRNNDFGERLAYGAYIYSAQGWNAQGGLIFQKSGKIALLPGDKVQLQVAPTVLTSPDKGEAPSTPEDKLLMPMAHTPGISTFDQVGIGTTSPSTSLHIHDGIFRATAAIENAYLLQGFTDGGALSNIGVALHADTYSASPYLWLAVAGTPWGGPANTMVLASTKNAGTTRDLWIYANDSLTPSVPNILVQANTGRVGIGTTSPSATLEVHGSATNLLALYDPTDPSSPKFRVAKDGNVYADGAYYGAGGVYPGGADVAERINTSEWVEPGDVVEIDPEHPGFFRKTRVSYSSSVAGSISSQPGVVLGNSFDQEKDKWDDERPVLAIAGRVLVKAATENGPIAVGDLLVSSSTPGVAMKGAGKEALIGAVVGKAMEPLEEGTGMIQVQVTLR